MNYQLIFSIGMNELAEVWIGSFIGDGNLDVSIAGEEAATTILCSWGPSIGFYLYVLSMIILILIIIFNVKKIFKKKK